MDPITLILLGIGSLIAGGAAAAVIFIAYLTYQDLMSWFRQRLHRIDHVKVAATILDHIENGNVRTVQGIFNTQTSQWVEQRTIESSSVSADLLSMHAGSRAVIHYL